MFSFPANVPLCISMSLNCRDCSNQINEYQNKERVHQNFWCIHFLNKKNLFSSFLGSYSIWLFDLWGNKTYLWDRSPSPSLMNDVSAVSVAAQCRLDIKWNLKLAAIFTFCSEVSTHCPDRHKATEPCPVYQKHPAAKIIFFFINQDWQRGKIGRVLSGAHGQEPCEF